MAVYVYEINDGEVSLTGTKYLWVKVDQILSDLCDSNRYFEAAYLSEAYNVL